MYFRIRFFNYGFAISLNQEEIGLEGVDKIREELKINLPLGKIQGEIDGIKSDVSFILSEEQARETGLFSCRNSLTVTTSNGKLNDFVEEIVTCGRDPSTDEIKWAKIERKVNEEKIWEAWKEAGFPTVWE